MSNANLVTRGKALVPHCDDPSDYTEDDRTILAMADAIEALEAEVARLHTHVDEAEHRILLLEPEANRAEAAEARAKALEEALRDARKAALEEAAGIAETCEWWTDTSGTMDERVPIARAIRARAEEER